MIGIYAKIPYHAQIRKADPVLAAELLAAVREAARRFGARAEGIEESFYLAFDASAGCSRLRAAEATRFLESALRPLSGRLHGWNVIVGTADAGTGEEELIASLKRRWRDSEGDGVLILPASLSFFEGYLAMEGDRSPRAVFAYASPALPEGWNPPELAATTRDRFIDEAGRHLIGESGARLLLAVGPSSAPSGFLEAGLAALYPEQGSGYLRIHGSVAGRAPYGPFLEAIASTPGAQELALLSEPDRLALESHGEVASFLRASPFRQDFSAAIGTKARLYVAARLRLYARKRRLEGGPAVVILEGLDRFSPQSQSLVVDLLEDEGLSGEGLVVFGSAVEPPPALPAGLTRIVAAPPPSPAAIARSSQRGAELAGLLSAAADLAAAAEGDEFRLRLALRSPEALPKRRWETPELARLAFMSFPVEFAEFVLALHLSEEVLDDRGFEDFMESAGFVAGIRPLIIGQLARLGLVSADPRPRLLRAEAAPAAAARAESDGAALAARFAERVLAMHAAGRIKPSEALFERIGGVAASPSGRGLLYLDCVAADALYGPSRGGSGPLEDPPLDGLSGFLASYARADRKATAQALARLEAQAGRPDSEPLVTAIAALCRAFDEYAAGQAALAASHAKPALIGLHSLGARRGEARAHRLLGLCALAQSQVQEGSDYLSNACELAEEASDPFERILSAYAEAGAQLVLGDLRRAQGLGAKAALWARASFRSDWETAADFLAGRLSFELGCYAEAAEAFGRIRATARVYLEPRAAARAEVWAGRTAAYAGQGGLAASLLRRHGEDAEALWFLAELAHFEGRNGEAASLASSALALAAPGDWQPADAIGWNSGFDNLEARALGFGGRRSYLEDQIGAFASFASALVDRRPEHVLDIAMRTREDRLAALHPQAHIYHYYCYLALSAPDGPAGPSVDAATVFSKAFKALQTRTAHMDEAGLKDEYLEANRWNRLIMEDARRHKLI